MSDLFDKEACIFKRTLKGKHNELDCIDSLGSTGHSCGNDRLGSTWINVPRRFEFSTQRTLPDWCFLAQFDLPILFTCPTTSTNLLLESPTWCHCKILILPCWPSRAKSHTFFQHHCPSHCSTLGHYLCLLQALCCRHVALAAGSSKGSTHRRAGTAEGAHCEVDQRKAFPSKGSHLAILEGGLQQRMGSRMDVAFLASSIWGSL